MGALALTHDRQIEERPNEWLIPGWRADGRANVRQGPALLLPTTSPQPEKDDGAVMEVLALDGP